MTEQSDIDELALNIANLVAPMSKVHQHTTFYGARLDAATVAAAAAIRSERERHAADTAALVEACNTLTKAISALPVEEMVEQDPRDGSPTLLGYCMQVQGEWDDVRKAKDAVADALAAMEKPHAAHQDGGPTND